MKITKIGYGETISDRDSYGNKKYYFEAELEEWETDIDACLLQLKQRVQDEQRLQTEVSDLQFQKRKLQHEIDFANNTIAHAKARWQKVEAKWLEAEKFLEFHGLKMEQTLPEIPFAWMEEEDAKALADEIEADLDLEEDLLY